MKKLFFVFSFAFSVMSASAQTAAKSAYVELGGAGIASINYDMRFSKKEDGLGFRAGVGGFSVSSNFNSETERFGIITIPLEINYLIGKDQKNYFELGAGGTFVNAKSSSSSFDEDEKFTSSFGHLSFGYRRQPVDGGFLFRASIVPLFGKGYFVPYWAGVSFGYKF